MTEDFSNFIFKLMTLLRIYLIAIILLFAGGIARAQEDSRLPGFPPDKFFLGKILEIKEKAEAGEYEPAFLIRLMITSGEEKNKEVEVESGIGLYSPEQDGLGVGETVIVQKTEALGKIEYAIYDRYRIAPIIFIAVIFFALVVFFSRIKGAGSILGLGISIFILGGYIVPRIIQGEDPLFTSLIGAFGIALLSLFTAHGLNRRTAIALLSTILTLGLSAALAIFFVYLSKLTGLGSEGSFYLQTTGLENLNPKGILLGGIIIGALGILDDITTAQTAAVDEIRKANPAFSLKELYRRGLSVGKEHIASLVNTLVLAYAGASMPLFILFSINPNSQPFWVTLNSEFIAEEIIRTLVGSVTLVLAVPIATFLAAYFLQSKENF